MLYLILILILIVISFFWLKNIFSPKFIPTEQDKLIEPFIQSCFASSKFIYTNKLNSMEMLENQKGIYNSEKNKERRQEVENILFKLKTQGKITIPERGVMSLTDEFKKELYPFTGSYIKYLASKLREEKRGTTEFQINLVHRVVFPAITLLLSSTAIYFNLQSNKLKSQVEDLKIKQRQDSIFIHQKIQSIADLVLIDSIPKDSATRK